MSLVGRVNTAEPINRRSPLADSIVSMWAIPPGWAGNKIRDLNHYQDSDVSGKIALASGHRGMSGWVNAVGGGFGTSIVTPKPRLKIVGDVTIEWFGYIYGTGDTFSPLAYMSYTNGNVAHYANYGFDRDVLGNGVRFFAGAADNASFYTATVNIGQFGLTHVVGTMSPSRNQAYLWINGEPKAQSGARNQVYGSPELSLGMTSYNSTLGANTSCLAISIRNRFMSGSEIQMLRKDAWSGYQDLFNRKSAVVYFVPAASTGTTYFKTLNIDGISDIAEKGGFIYPKTLTVDGLSGLTTTRSWDKTLTVAGVSDFTISGSYTCSVTVGSFSAAACAGRFDFQSTLTLHSIADITSPGGVAYFVQRSIEGFAATSQVDGFSYYKTLDVEGISDLTADNSRFQNLTLTIDGTSNLDLESQHNANLALAVAGIAAATLTTDLNSVNFLTLAWTASLHIENIYDFLLATNAISGFTAVGDRFTGLDEEQAAVGSFSATCTGVFGRHLTHSLALTQSATYKKPTGIIAQALVLTQAASVKRVSQQFVEQDLTLTQSADWSRTTPQTLVLTQTVAVTKVISRSVVQTLALTQQSARTTTMNRTVAQTLVFNVPRLLNAPIIAAQGGSTSEPVVPSTFHYYQPVARPILVPKKCLVVLGTPQQSVVLPCPEFGDTQAITGEINLKRTMTGETYTYVRKTQTEKLKYTFNIGSYKQVELRNFILNHSHELMTLLNWKGEFWYVFLTNNPTEFTFSGRWQPIGERVNVTLEFEGIKT